jgi:hypothetical protein
MDEIRRLNKRLNQAKSEHESLLDQIETLRNEVDTAKREKGQILAKYHMDREIFARMIKVYLDDHKWLKSIHATYIFVDVSSSIYSRKIGRLIPKSYGNERKKLMNLKEKNRKL